MSSGHSYDTTLTDEYIAAAKRPPEVLHDFRSQDDASFERVILGDEASLARVVLGGGSDDKENNGDPSLDEEPVAFVIGNVLTPTECDDLIAEAEDYGIREGEKYVARSAKRTKNYTNPSLSMKIEERIRPILEDLLVHGRETDQNFMGPIKGIHDNWRVLRYDADGGDAFPAHQDQMDSSMKFRPDGSGRKDLIVSSHTLLVQLSDNTLEGGCTRFYPRGTMRLPKNSANDEAFRRKQFDYAVDVALPKGWALVFRQRGLMHAGQPLAGASPCPKHVAQAGILRVLPEGVLQKPAVFKNGVGVTKLVTYEEMRQQKAKAVLLRSRQKQAQAQVQVAM